MRLLHDPAFVRLGAGLLAILVIATVTGQVLARRAPGDTVANLNARIRAWWVMVIVVQISDVAQYLCGKLLGRHPLSPRVSPNKTWEGLIGGGLIAVGVGTAIWWATPFGPAGAAGMAVLVVVMGAGGGLVMSGIK